MDGRRAQGADRGAPTLTRFPEWRIAGPGDFNGDGNDDLLVRHADGAWHYYALDGAEIVAEASGRAQITDRLDWQLVGVGDFNGNGRHDVLLRHVGNGNWTYYPMDGRRPVASGRGFANLTKALVWQPVAVGDFNGDGRDDVMARHTDGSWRYYPMRGRKTVTGGRRVSLPANLDWQVAAVGDFNGDGSDDLMLRHVNGSWAYYPMNGHEVIAAEQGAASVTRNLDWSMP